MSESILTSVESSSQRVERWGVGKAISRECDATGALRGSRKSVFFLFAGSNLVKSTCSMPTIAAKAPITPSQNQPSQFTCHLSTQKEGTAGNC